MSSSLPQDLENLVYNFRFINFTYMPDFGTDKKGQQTQPFPIRVGQYLVEDSGGEGAGEAGSLQETFSH